MIKVMFICHGNICRSPMAEFVFKDMVAQRGLEDKFLIASAATSTEELGNPVHHGTTNKLRQYGISTAGKKAVQVTKKDYEEYDYLVVMDQHNVRNLFRMISSDPHGKVKKLLDFTHRSGDIADPWYTGNFDDTYEDIREGCEALLKYILKEERT